MKDKAKSMKIYEVADRAPELIENLVAVWEKSVRATHNFLSDSEIIQSVPWSALCSRRTSAENLSASSARKTAGLRCCSSHRRRAALGLKISFCALELANSSSELTVNEQNPVAVGFYERMGFATYKHIEFNEQSNPHPPLCIRCIGIEYINSQIKEVIR